MLERIITFKWNYFTVFKQMISNNLFENKVTNKLFANE